MVNHNIDFSRSEAGIAQPWLSAPFGIYRTADGWIALAMGALDAVADVFGDPKISEYDPWLDRDAIKRRLDELAPQRGTAELLDALLRAGLWAAPVRTMKEAAEELAADGSSMVVNVTHASGQPLQLVGCPITLSETPWRQRLRPPAVGEHTEEVLGEVLSAEEILHLRGAGVL